MLRMSPTSKSHVTPLAIWERFFIYALHGFATEIFFTAGWEFVVNLNSKLPGNSSLWSFPIYGVSALVTEQLYVALHGQGVPLPLRVFVYTLWTYLWEFATGWMLMQFAACPWDYTLFDYNVMGLITLEYAPGWCVANILMDIYLVPFVLQLGWMSSTWTSSRIRASKKTGNSSIKHQDNGDIKQRVKINGDTKKKVKNNSGTIQRVKINGSVKPKAKINADSKQNAKVNGNIKQKRKINGDIKQKASKDIKQKGQANGDIKQTAKTKGDIKQKGKTNGDIKQKGKANGGMKLKVL